MILKSENSTSGYLSLFDLLGSNEVSLTKALAYIFSVNSKALFAFLHYINISYNNTFKNYSSTQVIIEKKRAEGRTDLELINTGKFHVIIEAKVRGNKLSNQRTQYMECFDKEANIKKIMCFITQARDTNIQKREEVTIINLSWFEIISIFDKSDFEQDDIIKQFVRYAMRNYKLNQMKEVLVQDLSDPKEIIRFKEFNIYRRDNTYGTPLYFAPYFTRKAEQKEGEGIVYIAKILGVLTFAKSHIDNIKQELRIIADNNELIYEKWIEGISKSHEEEKAEDYYTYYFLAKPIKFSKSIIKQDTDWLPNQIPRNMGVSFEKFIEKISLQ